MRYKLLFIIGLLYMSTIAMAQTNIHFTWGQLAPIPDQFGFAGSFAGVSHGALIVAGGANFPNGGAPWTGATKAWTDQIFVLDQPTGQWKIAGHLPQPMGYGVSITYQNKVFLIGGSNAAGHLATVIALSYVNGKINIEHCADLPQPLANACGALAGTHTAYIAGGLFNPADKKAADIFWCLDLQHYKTAQWKALPTWPGQPRMLSVAATSANSFYLFSGTALQDRNGTAHRQYLTDAYKYTPGKGWRELHQMPTAVVAAPGPAISIGKNELFIFGGDDGKLADDAANLKDKHPGFSDRILIYHKLTDTWHNGPAIKTDKKDDAANNPNNSTWAPVTSNAILWQGQIIFPGGEVRPAVRTPRVLTAIFKK